MKLHKRLLWLASVYKKSRQRDALFERSSAWRVLIAFSEELIKYMHSCCVRNQKLLPNTHFFTRPPDSWIFCLTAYVLFNSSKATTSRLFARKLTPCRLRLNTKNKLRGSTWLAFYNAPNPLPPSRTQFPRPTMITLLGVTISAIICIIHRVAVQPDLFFSPSLCCGPLGRSPRAGALSIRVDSRALFCNAY
jgi:hypothetical protein